MKRIGLFALASSVAIGLASPASAAPVYPGQSGVIFTPLDTTTRGIQLASIETGTLGATTYTGFLRSAVYRNTLGTLDFYFQVAISSIAAGDEVFNLTASSFLGYTVDAFVDTTDFDGAGFFTAANNPICRGLPAPPPPLRETVAVRSSGPTSATMAWKQPARRARPTSSAPTPRTITLAAHSRRRMAQSPSVPTFKPLPQCPNRPHGQ